MSLDDHIWYAVNQTRVLVEPRRTLETFGASRIDYVIACEALDRPGLVRLREGVVTSARPRLLLPGMLAQELLDGFGDEARAYAEWLTRNGDQIQILEYGLQISRQEVCSHEVHEPLEEVLGKLVADAARQGHPRAVIAGVDEAWEISLLKFLRGHVLRSAPGNSRDLRAAETAMRQEARAQQDAALEEEFYRARGHRERLAELGAKLRSLGLFDRYEDRFYSLWKEVSR
ncbi:MAG: hypothetical protein RL095_2119 [Verrucomicrobiota bacterium]|jgi:hypothetical protein